MNFRRLFIFIVLALTFVGCEKRDDAVGKGSWTQEVWQRGDKIYNGILRQHTQEALDGGNSLVALAAMLPCMWIYNRVGLYEYAFWDYGYSGPEKDYSYVTRLEEWL